MLNKIGLKTDHCGTPFISVGQKLKGLLILFFANNWIIAMNRFYNIF